MLVLITNRKSRTCTYVYIIWIGTKLMTLNHDLERRNGSYFVLLRWMRQILKATTSNCLKVDS